MLQEVLSQELSMLETELIECDELGEVMAAGVGCKNNSCGGSCSSKSNTTIG